MSQTIKLPRLHSAQQQIVNESKRFNVLATGRRFGKTTLGIDRLLRHALAGKPVAWFAPTYRLLMAMWRELVEILGDVGDANRNDKFIQLPGGGSFEAWSLDTPSPARSRKYAAIVIDEAGHAADLKAQWDNAIRPTLTDFRGEAWFLSSPNGLNFFHQLWQRGNDPEREDWASWQMPTAANPYIAADEIESARIDMAELAFRQEYLAEFVSWEGAVFRRIGNCLWNPPEELKRQQRVEPWHTWQRTVAIGCDWGRTNDYTVFTVATDDPFRPTVAGDLIADNQPGNPDNWNSTSIVEVDRFRGVEFAMQRTRLFALWERYGRPVVLAESNSIGMPVIEQLAREGMRVIPFHTSNSSKAEIIDALALDFERGRIRIPADNPVLIGELQAFEATRLQASGLMRYAAPEGGHDDTVVSLALARHALAKYGVPYSYNPYHLQRKKNAFLRAMDNGGPGALCSL
jgi:Terminase large subunit, T4likevirus-type, N-terminal